MVRRWGWFATLGALGSASLLYVVIIHGLVDPSAGHSLGWPLLGVLPIFVFGMWLLTVSPSRTAVLIATGGTAMLLGTAYETVVQRNLALIEQPWFPLFNLVGLTADAWPPRASSSCSRPFRRACPSGAANASPSPSCGPRCWSGRSRC